MSEFQEFVECVLNDVANILLEKNNAYGNSALDPVRIFSKADTLEQINVRIDDKLSRLSRGDQSLDTEDVELDLIGYLVLKRVARSMQQDGLWSQT